MEGFLFIMTQDLQAVLEKKKKQVRFLKLLEIEVKKQKEENQNKIDASEMTDLEKELESI